MSSASREASRDRERTIGHKHSFSETSKSALPMWDSSDPERAPPPLPLNPSSPGVTTKPNTSLTVAAAAAALTERARESSGATAYTTNPAPNKREASPDKSLIKGHHHKRMHTLQSSSGSVKDLSSYLENNVASPERSPERHTGRSSTPLFTRDMGGRSPEKSPTRSSTPTSHSRENAREASGRGLPPRQQTRGNLSLAENTPPPSSGMLALPSIPSSSNNESPLASVTNAAAGMRTPQTFDALSTQILSLTGIATNLQREMTQLSRRSKDNATDLISLKEATNLRDEDIRKSLRELVSNLSSGMLGSGKDAARHQIDGAPHDDGTGSFLLDNKPHVSPPAARHTKNVMLPRIPSPGAFAATLERDLANSPSPFAADSEANLALLEKILREMGTKEGQDRLISSLGEVVERMSANGTETARKLEEVMGMIRDGPSSRALVAHKGRSSVPGRPELEFQYNNQRGGSMPPASRDVIPQGRGGGHQSRKPYSIPGAAEFVGDDIQKLLRRLKDSVTENGGMTAEVKALVRELRGEVLGMGRELGRKLTEAGTSRDHDKDLTEALGKEDVARIVQEGLDELREQMERVLSENRRQSSSSAISRNVVDSQEVYEAVRHAVTDLQLHQPDPDQQHKSGMEKEEILSAVREAWETYKPEIELQNFGLERDEVLQCLKEGLEEYRPAHNDSSAGVDREEVLDAIREGLEHFQPPPIQSEASMTREEILMAVRESLESFDFPTSRSLGPQDSDLTRDVVVDAVREGLGSFDLPRATPEASGLSRQVLEKLNEVIEGMRFEFKGVSDEAKQNVAANGRDTEQVLDAFKDGLECLRSDVEAYVDRAADVTGKDEIIETLRDGFENLRLDVGKIAARGSDGASADGDMLDSMKGEFEHLRETIATAILKSSAGGDKDEILDVLREGFDELRSGSSRGHDRPESVLSSTGEILDALNDGLDSLRSDVTKMVEKPVDMTVSYEILDTLKDGLAGVRAELDRMRPGGGNMERELGPDGGQMVVAEGLKRNDIENLEVLITQLRIKVEALDAMSKDAAQAAPAAEGAVTREDLNNLEELLKNVRTEVVEIAERERGDNEDAVKKDDIDAIETLLINTKAKIDDMVLPNSESAAKQEQVEAVEDLVRETKEAVEEFSSRVDAEGVKKEDMGIMESMLKEVVTGLEELKERAAAESSDGERVTKTDIDALAELCADTKLHFEQMSFPDASELASKDDMAALEDLVKRFRDRAHFDAEANAQAIEDRRLESEGLAERLGEVKGYLKGLREDLKSQLDDGSEGIEALGKLVEGLGETLGSNATVAADVKEMAETISREFERSHGMGEGLKLDNEQKSAEMLQKLDERFDEIMTKYDDAQLAAEAKAKATEERDAQKDEVLEGTRVVAEDLKLLIDTLGATITESADKMAEDSKTVFNRVDDTHNKIEEAHNEDAAQHQRTQEEVERAIAAIDSLQGEVSGYHPKILTSLQEVLLLVGQHYDHTKQHSSASREVPGPASTQPALTGQPLISDNNEKYDDAEVHSKLDKLINHANATGKSFARIDLLDQIQSQVLTTATEVSEFVSNQSRLIQEDREDKEKLAEEAAIALEKRLAQKDVVETDVVRLNDEKLQLSNAVEALREEKEQLAAHKMRLSADVASLETALRIRHEELVTMEARAEGLERRILDGVIDHSRALLISRPSKDPNSMSLKRVPSHASSTTPSFPQSGIGMALKSRPPPIRVNPAGPNTSGRRILSLNQITGNAAAGTQGMTQPAKRPTGGLGNLKRSHSVRTTSSIDTGVSSLRKSSWGGRSRLDEEQTDKENGNFTEEESYDDDSDTGTERRSSYTTSTDRRTSIGTVTGTLGTESTIEEADEEDRALTLVGEAQKEAGKMIVYDGQADSGMGDEIATADLHGGDGVVWAK